MFAPTASSRWRRRRTSGDGRGDFEEGAHAAPGAPAVGALSRRGRGTSARRGNGWAQSTRPRFAPRSLAHSARRAASP
eukprot:scaffold22164_cov146-Isochrysis_galbana.AAC.1